VFLYAEEYPLPLRKVPPTSAGDGSPAPRDGPYSSTKPSPLSIDCLATLRRGDLCDAWPVADLRPSELAGDWRVSWIVDGGAAILGLRGEVFEPAVWERDGAVAWGGTCNAEGAMNMNWVHLIDSGESIGLGTLSKIQCIKFWWVAKIVSSGVMYPMEILTSTNSMLLFSMVSSDLARNQVLTDFLLLVKH
jgi:hypothetical protein